jgi:hypothetical protein
MYVLLLSKGSSPTAPRVNETVIGEGKKFPYQDILQSMSFLDVGDMTASRFVRPSSKGMVPSCDTDPLPISFSKRK